MKFYSDDMRFETIGIYVEVVSEGLDPEMICSMIEDLLERKLENASVLVTVEELG